MGFVNRPTYTPRWYLLITAPATGAVVMALEILGSRLLAPVFGNSLFVWGALIGVILAAMSSGYAFGGWISDRYPGAQVLASLLLFSGAWTFLTAWLGQPVLFKVAAVVEDPRWGPCVAAALLLGPPAFGLSGVLPAMLRLAVLDLQYLGRHTGRIIALSAMGSLAGTWGTAFFFLSWIGSQALVAWLGAIQVGLGLWWLIGGTTVRPLVIGMFFLGVGGLGAGAWSPIQMLKAPVYQEDSPYQQVRIRDDDLFRYLVLDRTFHAVMWRADPVTLFLPYSQLMVASLALVSEPKRGLIIGHGGGSLAKWLAHRWPELELDVVEFDPTVVRMAEEYFSYQPPPQHHVHVRDARVFLNSTERTYDLIWVDGGVLCRVARPSCAERYPGSEFGLVGRGRRSVAGQCSRADDETVVSQHRVLCGQGALEVFSGTIGKFGFFCRCAARTTHSLYHCGQCEQIS